MESFGDRRQHPRFDVTGTFWVSLHLSGESRLRNISTTGALIEVPATPPWPSLRTMALTLRPGGPAILGVVRRQSPVSSDPDRQLVGLEFIEISPVALAELRSFLGPATTE